MKYHYSVLIVALILFSCNKDDDEPSVDATPISVFIEEQGENEMKLSASSYSIEIDGSTGGRISSFTFEEQEFLAGKDINSSNWGATFWPSPQDLWGWPPPAILDKDSFSLSMVNESILAVGQIDSIKTKLQFTKELSYNSTRSGIDITLTMTNHDTKSYDAAPWLITRVPADGITFCPVDTANMNNPAFDFEVEGGIFWFDYSGSATQASSKLVANGKEGWIAHYSNGYLFVHKYDDVANEDIAPKEGDVEIYVAPSKTYVEIEPQGEYGAIEPGASVDWTVTWLVEKVDNGVIIELGSQALIDQARAMVQ